MEKDKKTVFQRIKENPVHSVGQFFKVILLVIVSVLAFLTGIGSPLLMIVYVLAVIVAALLNFFTLAATWWIYLLAAVGGCLVIKVLSVILSGMLTALQQNLLIKAFGYPADENEGGAVPAACARPFDPIESELNELERRFESNGITQEEYERRKAEILNKGDIN